MATRDASQPRAVANSVEPATARPTRGDETYAGAFDYKGYETNSTLPRHCHHEQRNLHWNKQRSNWNQRNTNWDSQNSGWNQQRPGRNQKSYENQRNSYDRQLRNEKQ
ncbi:unnamed protein product, partial [Prorocentrum cordatum]